MNSTAAHRSENPSNVMDTHHDSNDENDIFQPLSDKEFDELDQFLLDLEHDDSIFCLSELDGLFTAVVSGPEMIAPSQWIEVIWGDPEGEPEWKNQQAFEHIFLLMMRHMNSTAATLMEAAEEFEPIFMERAVEDKSHLLVDEWCIGYMKGVALCDEQWDTMPNAITDFLAPMLMFASETGWKELEQMNEDDIEFWQRQITPAARRIHAYWLEQRDPGGTDSIEGLDDLSPAFFAANDEPFVREAEKVGRNDPCPCGSGKKYKKCCGVH